MFRVLKLVKHQLAVVEAPSVATLVQAVVPVINNGRDMLKITKLMRQHNTSVEGICSLFD